MPRYDFASDTVAGAMPEVMAALVAANTGAAASYGADEWSNRAGDLIRAALDADAAVKFFASGTAANAFALSCLVQPHEAVIAHQHAHICTDETGAPGFFTQGVGLIGLPGASGRIDLAALRAVLGKADGAHHQSAAALSLTQSTEYGARYEEADLAALCAAAKAAGLAVHLDGARLANAAAGGFDLKSIARMGVDVLVMGGSKPGGAPTEAVVFLNKTLERRLEARIKHAGQLIAKGRFLAAPWVGMLQDGAWTARAAHANAMARKLAALSPFEVVHPVQANAVFAAMDEPALQRLQAKGWAVYRFLDASVRFMCNWTTTDEMVEALAADLKAVA